MSLAPLIPLLSRTEEFSAVLNALRLPAARSGQGEDSAGSTRRRSRATVIVPDSATAYALAAVWREARVATVLVTPNPESARRLADQVAIWSDDDAPIHQFVETENIPFERYIPDPGASHLRLRALAALWSVRAELAPPGARPQGGASSARTDNRPTGGRSSSRTENRSGGAASSARTDNRLPPFVVASVQAIGQATVERPVFDKSVHTVRVGERHSLDNLVRRWTALGYRVEPTVEIPGTASRRGGILDIFPVSLDDPVRIEFFDDEVESIRTFDPATQRSKGDVGTVTVFPALEVLPGLIDPERVRTLTAALDFERCSPEIAARIPADLQHVEETGQGDDLTFFSGFFCYGSLFDYVPEQSLTIILRPSSVEEAAHAADLRLDQLRKSKEGRGDIPRNFRQPNFDWGLVADALNRQQARLEITPWGIDAAELPSGGIRLPVESQPLIASAPLAALQAEEVAQPGSESSPLAQGITRTAEVLARARIDGLRTVVVSNHSARLAEMAGEQGIDCRVVEDLKAPPAPGEVVMVQGQMREGFVLRATNGAAGLSVLTDHEVFGIQRERRRVRRRPVRHGPALEQLRPGTYVVHVEHGVGRFTGTTTLAGQDREFLVLEYAEDDKLYVPTEHLDRIQLYHSPTDDPPRLTRLGTQEWARARERAKRATEQLAGELIALYASRQVVEGFTAAADTPWQDALEASFPYEETPDQMAAIEAVKKDLESSRPMDRLICGDVGFGKTEVALRAAFKVVQSGRQVAVLVPTTVLAQQHYETFKERLRPFPVRVVMLSRFVSGEDERRALKALSEGVADICIGTHRMLQRDVSFKNLGLVIIDEEHKFGVSHKERLKRMRSQIDVMTLSATPIPRTLHMSLAGVRDMSTIETPPEERLPIKTYISEQSDELIREALLRELDRGGQAFVLHNRVKDIEEFAGRLQKLVPEATIEIGHGQMPEDELEEVMSQFARQEFDVLVCTTIIESGLDLPNANTLIVDRADMFGLSQLYQLRGRIGRGTNRAYCYLLLPRGQNITETAEQRLGTVLAATELGAGFQIAMRDLEIRGMGNLLGAEQSGHIAAIGFDLYTRLLAQAVSELKQRATVSETGPDGRDDGATPGGPGKDGVVPALPDFSTVRVDLGVDARIPETYIEDLAQRLSVYQRLARIHTIGEIDDLREELRDRFGPPPEEVALLLTSTRIKVLAERTNVDSVVAGQDRAVLALKEPTGGARQALQRVLGRGVEVGHMQIRVEIDRGLDDWLDELVGVMMQIEGFREKMLSSLRGGVLAGR